MGYFGALSFSSKEIVKDTHYKPDTRNTPGDDTGLGDKTASREADLGGEYNCSYVDQEPDQWDEQMAQEIKSWIAAKGDNGEQAKQSIKQEGAQIRCQHDAHQYRHAANNSGRANDSTYNAE